MRPDQWMSLATKNIAQLEREDADDRKFYMSEQPGNGLDRARAMHGDLAALQLRISQIIRGR